MKLTMRIVLLLVVLVIAATFVGERSLQAQEKLAKPPFPDLSQGIRQPRGRGDATEIDKLSPELRILVEQFTIARGEEPAIAFSEEQLNDLFKIKVGEVNPYVGVYIKVKSPEGLAQLKRDGAKVYLQVGDFILADVRIKSLQTIAAEAFVLRVTAAQATTTPPLPKEKTTPSIALLERGDTTAQPRPANEFNAAGLTGKGVIVGIVDTGIDWKHPDFLRADGTSRVLALWDMTDKSFATSKGKIGTAPPSLQKNADPLPGTVYTNEQINAALQGRGIVQSMDNNGHGTATAGTAASNGRATGKDATATSYPGVAPETDLLIVRADGCGRFSNAYLYGTFWIAAAAKSFGRPVVINHSLGGHATSHQGDAEEELILNKLIKDSGPGLAVTVSAGNEGQYSFHGAGRFGPYRKGQADVEGEPVELLISAQRTKGVTPLQAYFNPEDEWGLAIEGAGSFLVDEKGNPLLGYIYKRNNQINLQFIRVTTTDNKLTRQRADITSLPKMIQEWAQYVLSANNAELTKREGNYERLTVPLLQGSFRIWGFGISEKVKSGAFDVYLPYAHTGGFTIGATKKQMVGSPGNAAEVITVGAYDFRSEWINREGKITRYNLPLGRISEYSSPGGPRTGGIYKPEIAAPATYTISSLSQAATEAKGECGPGAMGNALGNGAITSDGYHIAWQGTSASAPYVAGVIALMLQKNPSLTNLQVKQILIRTATKGDDLVGTTPNPEWGYGRINPAAAITATPSRTGARKK